METQVAIWSVGDPEPVRLERSGIPLEINLESWTEKQPSILMEGLQVVARQLHVDAGRIDLLCLDAQERWVIVEFKRDRLNRDTISQALDYAACIQTMDPDDLRVSLARGLDRLTHTESVLAAVDHQLRSENADREVSVIVTGTSVDPALERVVRFLDGYDLPIRVVTFEVFGTAGGEKFLVREVLEGEVSASDGTGQKKRAPARTIESFASSADREGVGEAFAQIVSAAQAAGIYCRPYKKSVMFAPESMKNRYLMLLQIREGQGLWVHHGAEAFAEFFPGITAQEVEDSLGASGIYWDALTENNWEDQTRKLVKFFEKLVDLQSSSHQ